MFAAIASGNPLQLSEEVPNSNGLQHTLVLSESKPKTYSHVSLFILPNVTFPPEFVAIVYFKLGPQRDFQMFGYLDAAKPSAIFKVRLQNPGTSGAPDPNLVPATGDGLGEIDMDDNVGGSNISGLIIGVSIEPRDQGMQKLAEWSQERAASGSGTGPDATAGALVPRQRAPVTPSELARLYPAPTQALAATLVRHAYNYLSGFLDNEGRVPMKCFDAWWEKFQQKLSRDSRFLDEVTK